MELSYVVGEYGRPLVRFLSSLWKKPTLLSPPPLSTLLRNVYPRDYTEIRYAYFPPLYEIVGTFPPLDSLEGVLAHHLRPLRKLGAAPKSGTLGRQTRITGTKPRHRDPLTTTLTFLFIPLQLPMNLFTLFFFYFFYFFSFFFFFFFSFFSFFFFFFLFFFLFFFFFRDGPVVMIRL